MGKAGGMDGRGFMHRRL